MRVTEAGVELDAEFEIDEIDGRLAVTMHSHSGASGSRPRRNPQYGEALRVILGRLAGQNATITDALVVSSDALRKYPDPGDRRLTRGVRFPVRIADHDPGELRRTLTEAMRATARDPSLGPGGNNRRRVTFFLDVPGRPTTAELGSYLSGGAPLGPGDGGGTPVRASRLSVPQTTGPAATRRSRAQGYVADAVYRRAVELHAMAAAIAHYARDGWQVKDTSAGHPYDLLVTRGGQRRFVEVKGTAGLGEQVNLTANEVQHARDHPGDVVLFVVHSIDVDRSDPAVPRTTGGVERIIDALDLDAGQLRPTAYTWALPSDRASGRRPA